MQRVVVAKGLVYHVTKCGLVSILNMIIRSAFVILFLGMVLAQDDFELGSGARLLMKIYEDCQRKGFTPCLKMKAIGFFDRAARSKEILIGDMLTIVRDSEEVSSAPLNEADLEAQLPRSDDARDARLNSILFNRVADFFNNHRVTIGLPKMNPEDLEQGVQEGRGKMKKMMSMMMMGVAMKMAAVIPIAIGVLFLLAGKALIISKIALVLTLIIALKKLLSQKQSHGHEAGWQSSGGWDRRSYNAVPGAQEMAYRQTNDVRR